MELVEGHSLHERLAGGPLPLEESLSVVRQIVRGLEERGARVAVFDLEADEFRVDVTDRDAIEAATKRVGDEWGVPHILVNAAALDSPPDAPPEEVGPVETYPEESFDRVMDVNVKGTFLCCQVIGARMAEAGRGSIVNISSVYGMLSPVQDVYDFRRARGETAGQINTRLNCRARFAVAERDVAILVHRDRGHETISRIRIESA